MLVIIIASIVIALQLGIVAIFIWQRERLVIVSGNDGFGYALPRPPR